MTKIETLGLGLLLAPDWLAAESVRWQLPAGQPFHPLALTLARCDPARPEGQPRVLASVPPVRSPALSGSGLSALCCGGSGANQRDRSTNQSQNVWLQTFRHSPIVSVHYSDLRAYASCPFRLHGAEDLQIIQRACRRQLSNQDARDLVCNLAGVYLQSCPRLSWKPSARSQTAVRFTDRPSSEEAAPPPHDVLAPSGFEEHKQPAWRRKIIAKEKLSWP